MSEILKTLCDIWYLHPEEGWKRSFILSLNINKNGAQHYLVAGYGPPIYFKAIITVEEYLIKEKLDQLDTLKRLIEAEMVERGLMKGVKHA